MKHAAPSTPSAPVVIQALPVASAPVALNVILRQFAGKPRFSFNGDPSIERGYPSLPESERATHEVLHGHVHFGIDRHLPRRALYLTILRDPVESALAFYFMVLASPAHYLHPLAIEQKWTPADLLDRERPEIDNPQVRWLNPVPDQRIPFGQVTPQMLENAKRAIEERYVFGLAERVDESLVLLRRTLGWDDVSYAAQSMLAQRSLQDAADAAVCRRLRELNRFDDELYRHASALFETRIREAGPEFTRDLDAFRESNRQRAAREVFVAGRPVSLTVPPEFAHAKDVVWLASYPRSGNTWLRFLLDAYFFPPARMMQEVGRLSGELDWWMREAVRLGLGEAWIAYAGHEVRQRYPRPADCPADLFFKTHYEYTPTHPLRARGRAAIYLLRDPRDVLLSGMNFADLTQAGELAETTYAREFVANAGDPAWRAMGYGTWASHARTWLEQQEIPILDVRYEALRADPAGQLRRILAFIGVTPENARIARAVELSELSRLRNLEVASRLTTDLPDLKKQGRFFFHQGRSGQSVDHLGIGEQFRAAFAADAARWGYTL